MPRNSKLLNKCHKFYGPVVEILHKQQPYCINIFTSKHTEHIDRLAKEPGKHPHPGGVSPTGTLVSKNILATTAGIVAFDSQALRSFRDFNINISSYKFAPREKTEKAANLTKENIEVLREEGKPFRKYPPIKLMDMYLRARGSVPEAD